MQKKSQTLFILYLNPILVLLAPIARQPLPPWSHTTKQAYVAKPARTAPKLTVWLHEPKPTLKRANKNIHNTNIHSDTDIWKECIRFTHQHLAGGSNWSRLPAVCSSVEQQQDRCSLSLCDNIGITIAASEELILVIKLNLLLHILVGVTSDLICGHTFHSFSITKTLDGQAQIFSNDIRSR